MARKIAFRHLSATADLTLWGDETATLSTLYSKEPRRGHSRALMHQILAYADERNLEVILEARRFGNTRGMDNDQLAKFYEEFGFETQTIFRGHRVMKRIRGFTMQAILLSPETLQKALEHDTTLREFDHDALLESVKDNPNYFIPQWDRSESWHATSWALVPEEYMDDWFEFDKDGAATDFVELKRIEHKV